MSTILRSALYYPHTRLRGSDSWVLKSALLLWDRLEFIVPDKAHPLGCDGLAAEAMELIGVGRVPTKDEMEEAHQRIEQFVSEPLPPSFYYTSEGYEDYELWPQKFLPKTWDLLKEAKFAGMPLPNSDMPVTELAGLSLMAILADCCAGTTRARITDRPSAYAAITSMLARTSKVAADMQPDPQQRLASIPLPILDPDELSLNDLIAFRRREESEPGLRQMRHAYLDHLNTYVALVGSARTSADVDELSRMFREDVKDDLDALTHELTQSKRDFASSKWVFATVIGLPLAAIAHACGASVVLEGVVTMGGLPLTAWDFFGSLSTLEKRKSEILKSHPTAYLYQLRRQLEE